MSDEAFFTDSGFGEFVVSANGHFDKDEGVWFKPWTNRPGRNDIGYVVVKHPSDEVASYTYLMVDPLKGEITWYFGPFGNPELDSVIGVMTYRQPPDG
jgi:hypothetical protein